MNIRKIERFIISNMTVMKTLKKKKSNEEKQPLIKIVCKLYKGLKTDKRIYIAYTIYKSLLSKNQPFKKLILALYAKSFL